MIYWYSVEVPILDLTTSTSSSAVWLPLLLDNTRLHQRPIEEIIVLSKNQLLSPPYFLRLSYYLLFLKPHPSFLPSTEPPALAPHIHNQAQFTTHILYNGSLIPNTWACVNTHTPLNWFVPVRTYSMHLLPTWCCLTSSNVFN